MRLRNLFVITLAALISVSIIVYAFAKDNKYFQEKQSDNKNLPGNPLDGRIVFEKNKCINCHSINGTGGKIGPDFNSDNFLSGDYDLITEMWNHSPKMLKMIDQMNANQQKISAKDFRRLRYFISFLGYMSKTGNVSQGRDLFVQMRCNECHSVGKTIPGKIDLNKTGYNASPVNLAQTMWNHAAEMNQKQKASNIKISVFKGNDFTNLAAYLESISVQGKKKSLMFPGNPVLGEKLFNSKNCAECHLKENIGISFNNINLHKSVIEIAGMMWNHSGLMESAMGEHKISWPTLKDNEMGNLIAYLYYYNSEQVNGSVEEGQKMLESKGCLNCHFKGNKYKTLSAADIKPFDNVDELFSKLWEHIPIIQMEFYSGGKALPKLTPGEVKSIYLYFNRTTR
ncbi:MAG: c-type cytochrome [Ignavibacteriaceae bacterium]|nr:c-type cytochrome [Ignavibacteriaceae bacterium]